MIEAQGVTVSYGARSVLHGCDVRVENGQIVALFGHNGAGKTTLLRTLAGLKAPDSGHITIDDEDVGHMSANQRARLGVAFVPDGAAGVFTTLTVEENIAVACSGKASRASATYDLVTEMFPVVLKEKRKQVVSRLSGGQRQMVALSVALSREPTTILLDEPSIGLAPIVVQQMLQSVREVAQSLDAAVLIVEQDMPAALAIADHVLIMKQGRIVLSAPTAEFPAADALWQYF